jgi:hypothetical protein
MGRTLLLIFGMKVLLGMDMEVELTGRLVLFCNLTRPKDDC